MDTRRIKELNEEVANAPKAWEVWRRTNEAAKEELAEFLQLRQKTLNSINESRGGGFILPPDDGWAPIPSGTKDATMPNVSQMSQELDAFIDRLNGLPILFGEAFAFDTTPFEEAMGRINAAAAKSDEIARQSGRMRLQLHRQEQDLILETASIAASTLTTVFSKNKGAAIAAGLMNTAVGVTKALSSSPPPYNFIQAGLVAAAGMAQVAAIRSTAQTGGGGSVSVSSGGGSGGGDSGAESDMSSRANQTLFVQGIEPNQLLTGNMVREIMEQIMQAQRDGAQLVILPQGS